MNSEIFGYNSYKTYLNDRLDNQNLGGGRGSRTRLSRAIGCQTAYTAQVLRGTAHFSLEQAEAINEFLSHTEEQGHFFLLLIQFERSGTKQLRRRFERQIKIIRDQRLLLMNRLKVTQPLREREQIIYYSAWYYAAIHALVSIPKFQTVTEIAHYLQIDMKKVREAVDFLISSGLLAYSPTQGNSLIVGKKSIHLGADSPMVTKHHFNWRLQAMRALERSNTENLHYSSVITVSEKDASAIRELLVKTIESLKPLVRKSKEECLQCLTIDFFRIG